MTRTAIIAAMPGELKPLVRGWKHERLNGVDLWRHSSDGAEWIAACAGAGVDAATRAFAEVERLGPIAHVVSTGWAGALREELVPGEAYWVVGVIDARTGERFQTSDFAEGSSTLKGHDFSRAVEEPKSTGPLQAAEKLVECVSKRRFVSGHDFSRAVSAAKSRGPLGPEGCFSGVRIKSRPFSAACEAAPFQSECWLATSPKVADSAEKQRLASTYQAGLVDMEAAGVARLAQMRGIPFYCIKGISDGHSDQLPDFNRFISPSGKFKLAQFIVFVLLRPRYWLALMRMGENSRRAAQSIAASLLDFLEESGHVR
jgi:nucleoside phosphorylase